VVTQLRRSVVAAVLLAAVCGLVYPLVETGLAQALFPRQANGSLGPYGSTLIAQRFRGPQWFHGRPQADDPMASGPSNLGPRSETLARHVAARLERWRRLGVDPTAELVESSGSGLDPDISPAAAYAQVPMVARARGLPVVLVRRLVASHVHGRELGFLGAPYVNVLELDVALARLR
jgi:K+-transporting ATPase ATPase C chain